MTEPSERQTETQSSTWNYVRKIREQNTEVATHSKNTSNRGANGP